MSSHDPDLSSELELTNTHLLADDLIVEENEIELKKINKIAEMSTCRLIITVFASSIGNLLEWFDFAMFGLLADEIGKNFFPDTKKGIQILAAFGIFAGAFLMRPIGGALFGFIGDKYGRIVALRISLFMMAIPTFLTGCLPRYSSIGIISPILLTIFRLIQGVSVGGELIGAVTYVLEISPPQHKAFYNTLIGVSGCGALFGTIFVGILRVIFTSHQMEDFAWRIPFLFGVFVAIVGIWMRSGLPKSEEFMKKKESGQTLQNPIIQVLKHHKLNILCIVLHVMFAAASYYTVWIWLPEYVINKEINPVENIYLINAINMVISLVVVSFSGYIIDRYFESNPTFTLIIFGLTTSIYILIVFPFLNKANSTQILFIQMFYAIFAGMYGGGWSLWAIERFKNETVIRYSGFGIAYNIALALFGGTSPLIATALLFKYDYETLPLGLLLFVYGLISVGTNIVCYCFIDKHYEKTDKLSLEMTDLII